MRVPLLWSWPVLLTQGLVSDALVELTDIVPTLLDIVGLNVPRQMHGRSLLPILTGQSSPDDHREYVRSEHYDAQGGDSMFGTHVSRSALETRRLPRASIRRALRHEKRSKRVHEPVGGSRPSACEAPTLEGKPGFNGAGDGHRSSPLAKSQRQSSGLNRGSLGRSGSAVERQCRQICPLSAQCA